jgi:hypothetical protein
LKKKKMIKIHSHMYYTFSSHTFPFVTQWNERIGAVILFLKVCIIIENNTINKEKKKEYGSCDCEIIIKNLKYKVYFFILLFTWSTFRLQLLIFPHCLSISVSASSNYYQTNRRQKLQSAFKKKQKLQSWFLWDYYDDVQTLYYFFAFFRGNFFFFEIWIHHTYLWLIVT